MTTNNRPHAWLCLVLLTVTILSVWSRQVLSAEQGNSDRSKTKEALASITGEKSLIFHIDGVKFEFVRIPTGRFQMGSETGDSDERPVHQVRINESFYMGKTEVTVRQFQAFIEATDYQTDPEKERWA